ncbi:hypothetical protein [Elizabethkingia meningoseptica]|uniref:hypothetical protein n=1 Tax=Elizabethkingia meningoseptica TaxID=238 RepID=UPI000936C165|nr:hypothetical protein [Elizabethkingia meningoseptica]
MNTQEKKSYSPPCILSVDIVALEQGIAASSVTMTVGGTTGTSPEVTDWNEQPEINKPLDL